MTDPPPGAFPPAEEPPRSAHGGRRGRTALAALLWLALRMAVACGGTQATEPGAEGSIDLLRLAGATSYRAWMEREGWEDRRPSSSSARRFAIEGGALRLESAGDSFLIGRSLPEGERPALAEWPFLRFEVRLAAVPRGARLEGEARDDAAFRLYAILRDDPLQALVYVWSWSLEVGSWSRRDRSLWGDFRGVHRKSFGRGPPPEGWLTVEVDLRRDFRARFPGEPLPRLGGVALKADSNHTPGERSLAWLRAAGLHRASLREAGHAEGARLGDAVLWFR